MDLWVVKLLVCWQPWAWIHIVCFALFSLSLKEAVLFQAVMHIPVYQNNSSNPGDLVRYTACWALQAFELRPWWWQKENDVLQMLVTETGNPEGVHWGPRSQLPVPQRGKLGSESKKEGTGAREIHSSYRRGGRKGKCDLVPWGSFPTSLLCDSRDTVNKSPVLLSHVDYLLMNMVILDH